MHREGAIMRFYTRLVRASVRHRWITLAAGVMIFAASIAATKLLPSGFLPADDQGRALLALELPPGSRLDDTDRVTRGISDQLKKMPEVRSALIYGGQILGGAAEPRKATFVINFVNKSERKASQKDLQARDRRDARLDARHPLLVRQGQRPARPVADRRRPRHRRHQRHGQPARQRDALDPDDREPDLDRRTRPAGAAHRAQAPARRRPRRLDRDAVGDDPRRHARRRRRQPRQVQRRRPAGADPGRARRGGARRRRPAAGSARADRIGRRGAAVGARRLRRRPRPDRDQPLRPHAPRHHRGRPRRRRRARRRGRRDPRPARRQASAAGRRNPRDRRRRSDGRGVRLVRRGDRRRRDDGLRAAGAAVRQLPAADHHPRLAAAVGRRRDRRAAASPTRRCRCRWSSAS